TRDNATQTSPEETPEELSAKCERLFAHPVMINWSIGSRLHIRADTASSAKISEMQPLVQAVLLELSGHEEGKRLVEAATEGLRAQAAWLHWAGNTGIAQDALALARQMHRLPPSQNPVLARLIQASLRASN